MKSMKDCNVSICLDPALEGRGADVCLQCDPDNFRTAYRATKAFLKVCADREAFVKKVFEAVAGDLSDKEGMADTRDDEAGTITKEELMQRLSLELLSFEDGGIDILLGLDDLFTDHAYSLWMNGDGSISINGLWG